MLKVYSLLLDEKLIKNKDNFDETVPMELYTQRGSYYCGHCGCDLTELIENWDWNSGYCPACRNHLLETIRYTEKTNKKRMMWYVD